MAKEFSGSPVPRYSVFILSDGSFVVQWDEQRVQELLSGHYRDYEDHDFGYAITDYELNQLQAAGRVEHYNHQHIWLYALPERDRQQLNDYQDSLRQRVRSYYLNTTLPASRLPDVEAMLDELGLADEFLARVRGDLIAVLGKNGAAFQQLNDAERAQKQLVARASTLFEHTAIAFVETTDHVDSYKRRLEQPQELADVDSLIASQRDTRVTVGKRALLVTSDEEQREAIYALLADMDMEVMAAATAADGLHLLEDFNPDLLVMDTQLPDMHGWEMLAKIKEIGAFPGLSKLMIADHHASADDEAFALTVGKVDVYLVKPISMAQLRQNVWMTLKNYDDTND